MKCRRCGADNPDYSFFCGRCSADLKADYQTEPTTEADKQPLPTIESMIGCWLMRIEDNLRKKRHGVLGRFKSSFWHGSIVFKSKSEAVTLTVDKHGRASVLKGEPSGENLTLEGPQEAFVSMFDDKEGLGPIPDSIHATLADTAMPDPASERKVKDGIEKTLRGLLE
jgi:hypothetical protein